MVIEKEVSIQFVYDYVYVYMYMNMHVNNEKWRRYMQVYMCADMHNTY